MINNPPRLLFDMYDSTDIIQHTVRMYRVDIRPMPFSRLCTVSKSKVPNLSFTSESYRGLLVFKVNIHTLIHAANSLIVFITTLLCVIYPKECRGYSGQSLVPHCLKLRQAALWSTGLYLKHSIYVFSCGSSIEPVVKKLQSSRKILIYQ